MTLFSVAVFAALSSTATAESICIAPDLYSAGSVCANALGNGVDGESISALLQQARKSCQAGDISATLKLATEVVCSDPDNAAARRVLGYRRIGDQWAGNYAARRLERGEHWHPQFGWVKKSDLARYVAGERPLGKRWISAAEDAKRHANIDKGWEIRTDHFLVTTNHSRRAAAQLATRLELVYRVWQQQFGGFYLSKKDLLKRFDGGEISGSRSKPFEVNYYRTRDEYNALLVRQQPRIGMTLGIYFDRSRKTHFFAGDEQDAGTIYHEAVHQFFHESRRAARNVGASSNAWLTEGVACYFESLEFHKHHISDDDAFSCTIGRTSAGRLPAARHRRLVDDFYVPLAELSSLGIEAFQRRTDLPRLYSQSAGLVTFLMQYENGKYRPALIKTLQLLYAGRDQPSTLENLTGRSFAELDREYRRYLEALPTANAVSP